MSKIMFRCRVCGQCSHGVDIVEDEKTQQRMCGTLSIGQFLRKWLGLEFGHGKWSDKKQNGDE